MGVRVAGVEFGSPLLLDLELCTFTTKNFEHPLEPRTSKHSKHSNKFFYCIVAMIAPNNKKTALITGYVIFLKSTEPSSLQGH